MPRFSAFNPTRFSSRPRAAELIYKAMVADLGGDQNYSDDFDSPAMARVYANAMAFGAAKEALERAGSQFRPTRVLELLPTLEAEYGLKPEPTATLAERRADLAVAMRIARGASRENVEGILAEILGDDFVAYHTVDKDDAVASDATPGDSGIYVTPGTERSIFRLTSSVTTIGAPTTVNYEAVMGARDELLVGEKIAIDSGDPGCCEVVTITAATSSTLTATFTSPHTSGLLFATGRFPNLWSTKRTNLFVLSDAAAVSPRSRRRANRAIQRLLRGVSTWTLADDSGPFRVGVGRIGVTTIGAVP